MGGNAMGGLCSPTPVHIQQTTKPHTNKNSEGTFANRHALWDIKKALLTNRPSSTNKSHWFPNNTSPWMHSPTSSAQPHTSTINNLHNKRPLCVKSPQFGHYCYDIQCWKNILAAELYKYICDVLSHVSVTSAYTVPCAEKSFLEHVSLQMKGSLAKTLIC